MATKVFNSKRVQAAIDGSKPLNGLTQDYTHQGHWYTLMLSFDESVVYYFEAFGGALYEHSLITKNVQRFCGFAWSVVSVECAFQTCVSACGLWLMEAKRAFVEYLDSPSYGSKAFKRFFEDWMVAKGVVNLRPLEGTPQYALAKASNFGYISSCRDEACRDLAKAAADGQLMWTESGIAAFQAHGSMSLGAADLEERDDADVQ